ncbi:MAG: CPXCG motif-containing cysteine-rich protein [Verrucomicrobiota bacterium]
MDTAWITCPTCFEAFEVAVPPPEEMPAEVDYDCEICCRPMVIVFEPANIHAKGLAD